MERLIRFGNGIERQSVRSDSARLERQPCCQSPVECSDDCQRNRLCHASQRSRVNRHRHFVRQGSLAVHGERSPRYTGSTSVFRRDFDLDKGEKFDRKWITGWKASSMARENAKPYRTYRIAEGAKWTRDPFADPNAKVDEPKRGTQLHNRIHAMALASDDRLFVVHQDGRLKMLSTSDGYVLREAQVPPRPGTG